MNTWWSVSIETAADDQSTLDAGALDRFRDVLADHTPGVGGDERGYTARISIEAPDAGAAGIEATAVVRAAAEVAGLPSWPVVRSEVVRDDLFGDQLGEPSPPELVGTSEVATLFRVSRQRLSEIRKNPSLGFPDPAVELAAGPIWLRTAVELWLEGWERKPGRPRTSREVNGEPAMALGPAIGGGAEAGSFVAQPEEHDRNPAVERERPLGVEQLPSHLL